MSEIRIPHGDYVLVFDSNDLEAIKTSLEIGQVGESAGWAEYDFTSPPRVMLRFREYAQVHVERAS